MKLYYKSWLFTVCYKHVCRAQYKVAQTWEQTKCPLTEESIRRCDTYIKGILLLLLSRFSRVRLCATPQTAAHQALLPLGFSRQEHRSRLPLPSPCMKVKSESEVTQSCPTLSDPMDCSLRGSSIHGIFQARVLLWGVIAFSLVDIQAVSNILLI